MATATAAAVVAAAVFAVATALLHRSAELAGRAAGDGLARFVAGNARQPLWIAGMVAELAGFGLHALAVHSGPLTLVQPLLVSGLVFALPTRQLLERRRPSTSELWWAVLLAAGLALFLVAATPAEGPTSAPDHVPSIVSAAAVVVVVAVSAAIGSRTTGRASAAVLGFGAGVAFAAVAALLKVVTGQLANGGLGAAFGDWPLWALATAGVCGLLLNQLAFRAAPLRYSLPTLSTADPLVSLVIGAVVFDEPFRHSAMAIVGEVAGMALVIVTVIALTRWEVGTREAGGPAPAPGLG